MTSRTFRHSTSFLLVSACASALAAFSFGCSSSGEQSAGGAGGMGGSGANGGTAGTGGMGGSDGTPVPLSVSVSEMQGFDPTVPGPPLEGADLCETDTDNCGTSSEDGIATINLPSSTEVSYTVEHVDYLPYLVTDVTDAEFRGSFWPMADDDLLGDMMEALGISPPYTRGLLIVRALDGAFGGLEGVMFELVGETATPCYQEADTWTPTYALTATTSNGQGCFVELPAGEYEVEFKGATCTPSLAWPGNADNRIRVPVRDGYLTYASMNCDTP